MTWVAWRVQRLQFVTAAGVVVVLVLWLAASGLDGHAGWSQYWNNADVYVLYALPGVLGLAIGASLIAFEIDRGTNRLAWTQSITRTRWLGRKLLVGATVSAGLVAVLIPLLDWWTGAMRSGPAAVSNIVPKLFGITGFVAVGYVLFAFLLGITLGTVIGRPGWAFAAGLPIFGGVRLLVDGLRPTLVSPAFAVSPAQPFSGPQPNGWVLNAAYLPTGRTTPAPGQTWASSWDRVGSCFDQAQSQAGVDRCAAVAHLHYVVEYQPESHFWMLQGVEAAIYVGLTLILAAVTVIAIRRWRA